MLYRLTYDGGKTAMAVKALLGKKIEAIELRNDDRLVVAVDGAKVAIWDAGQSCCEKRYMTVDDDLLSYVGATIVDVTEEAGPSTNEDGEPHDTGFLRINTDAGTITVTTHVEHNGYYGGFALEASLLVT